MNAFNRAAMIVVALAMLAGAVLVLLVLAGAFSPGQLPTQGLFADVARRLAAAIGSARVSAYVIASVVAFAGLLLLVLELRPSRGRGGPFLVGNSELGRVTVERDGICRLADSVANQLEGIFSSRTRVTDGEQGICCRTFVSVAADSPVKDIGGELQKQIKEAIERQVGLIVEEVEVRVRIAQAPAPPARRVIE